MTETSHWTQRLGASERLLVSHVCAGMKVDHVIVAIAEDDVPDGRSSLFIQADTLLVVKADMEQRGAAPAHPDVDMPFAGVMLTDMNVRYRPPWRSQRGQLALQYQFTFHAGPVKAIL